MNDTTSMTKEAARERIEAIKDAYMAEIAKYPNLKVCARPCNMDSDWPKWNIQVHSTDEEHGDRFHDVLNVQVENERWVKTVFTVKMERHTCQGGRGRKRTYKKNDNTTLAKIAKEASEMERGWVESSKRRDDSHYVSSKWQEIRRTKLSGMALHPCIRVSIVEKTTLPTETDAAEPVFSIDFERYWNGNLGSCRLTLAQVKKITDAIAEVTGLDKAFAIIKRGMTDGAVGQWDGTWFQANCQPNATHRAKPYANREDAETELARMSEKNREGTEIVPYSQLV